MEEYETFDCSNCKNLEYSLEYFPKCEKDDVYNTPFKPLYDAIGKDNFITFINKNSDIKRELFFIDLLSSKDLNFKEYIKPLLKDKIMTEKAFKYKYRGTRTGIDFGF